MRNLFLTAGAAIGATVGWLLGDIDTPIKVLGTMMALDYVLGLCVAGFTHKSNKSATGGLSSVASINGLAKKFGMVGMVILANLLDVAVGTTVIRSGACFCLMANESLSIVENLGLLGVPIPAIIKNSIEVLMEKEGKL